MHAILNTPTRAPVLFATVHVMWEDHKHVERECDVEVEFTYSGSNDLEMLSAQIVGEHDEPYGISERMFDALVDDATLEIAPEVYQDWLSDQEG